MWQPVYRPTSNYVIKLNYVILNQIVLLKQEEHCCPPLYGISMFISLQKNLRAVLQRMLPSVPVHHISSLCYGLRWTRVDADRSERRSGCT